MQDKFEQAKHSFLEGLAHLQADRLAQAEQSFRASLALLPGRPSTLTNLGATCVRLGKAGEAVDLLEASVAADPANIEGWYNLGLARKAMGQYEGAIADFNQAAAIDATRTGVWMHRAQALGMVGRLEQAVASFDKVIALDATFGPVWRDRGMLLREMGRHDEAAASFEKAIALGDDAQLNGWFLASVNGSAAPRVAPRAYVENLFDQYADDFQEHLVDALQYRAHEVLAGRLLKPGARHYRSVLDLGCGTGLCGELLQPVAARIDGVDVSGAMVAQARALGVYTDVVHADILEYLASAERSDDLVIAADVFIYVGALDAVFEGVARILERGGRFCFTVEPAEGGADVQLLPTLRYAHGDSYVLGLAARYGFTLDERFREPLRNDQGEPLDGVYFYLTKA